MKKIWEFVKDILIVAFCLYLAFVAPIAVCVIEFWLLLIIFVAVFTVINDDNNTEDD